MTSLFICPFCGEEVARAARVSDVTEEALAAHLTSRHPIRRRLSRKTRRAFRQRPKGQLP